MRVTEQIDAIEVTGIDPYNKLIDRKPDDNTIAVVKSR
jgi:hypothetical protein